MTVLPLASDAVTIEINMSFLFVSQRVFFIFDLNIWINRLANI